MSDPMMQEQETEEPDDFAPEVLGEEQDEEGTDEQRIEMLARLAAFGISLSKTRREAIEGRFSSVIEQEWQEDEDAYQGIDDANRENNSTKPISPDGSSNSKFPKEYRSTVFMNITRPYVDAAAAKVADMLLPTDEKNWGLRPTPIPSLVKESNNNKPVMNPDGSPVMMSALTADGQKLQKPMTVGDVAIQALNAAKDAAEAAEKRISDWLVECQYTNEVRKVIEDCSRLGTGILKGPFPTVRRAKAVIREGGMVQVAMESLISPFSKRVDPWNFYPDPSCGDSIHDGSYVWERDTINAHQLQLLLDDPTYIPENVFQALKEGPSITVDGAVKKQKEDYVSQDDDTFEIWYFTGYADKEDIEAAGCECDEHEKISCVVTMVNDHVIKASLNPLDSGEYPYDVIVWQRRMDHWAGIGVGRQIRAPQRILNGGTRNMMDNAGLSAGPQIVARRELIEPADGDWQIRPRKVWWATEEAEYKSVQDALTAINIPSMQGELMGIINYALKMAEDVTSLPMLLQGQQGTAPETVGGMTMLNNNASTVMRRIARTFDDCLTEPHIRRYYEWLLLDPDVPAEEKGDFQVEARGSSALVERDIHNQLIAQTLQLSLNPAFGINPEKAYKEYLQSQRVDVRKLEYSEEEKKQMQQAQSSAQNPDAMRAQAMVQSTHIRTSADLQKANINASSDMQELQFKHQMQLEQNAWEREKLDREERIEMMKLAQQQRVSIDKIKAQLAGTAIKERTKKELFNAEASLKVAEGSGI